MRTSAGTLSLRRSLALAAAFFAASTAVLLTASPALSFVFVVIVSAAWCAWLEGKPA